MTDHADLIRRLAYGLDACLAYLDARASLAEKTERGKPMREITQKLRAEMAHKAVDEAFTLLDLPRD